MGAQTPSMVDLVFRGRPVGWASTAELCSRSLKDSVVFRGKVGRVGVQGLGFKAQRLGMKGLLVLKRGKGGVGGSEDK